MSAVFAPQGASTSNVWPLARNPAQLIATKLLKLPLSEIAEAAECDESGACRIRANERPCKLSTWLKLIDLCGYKLVSKEKFCVPRNEYDMLQAAYLELAKMKAAARDGRVADVMTLFEDPE
jgi:hypothetical protein